VTEPVHVYVRNQTWMAKLEFHLKRIETVVATSGLILLLALSLSEIGARNFFHTAIPGAEVLDRYLVLWISFFGAVLAVRERHIKIDAVAVWLPESWRSMFERPIFLFSGCVCGGLYWAAMRFWWEEWANALPAERWVAVLGIVIPLSFFLLTVHFALRMLIGPRSAERKP
jgi:TRAP-type transport system small permease protein